MKWISVDEKLPERYQTVLVTGAGWLWRYKVAFMDLVNDKMIWCDGWNCLNQHTFWKDKITHWMPLPAPPEKK